MRNLHCITRVDPVDDRTLLEIRTALEQRGLMSYGDSNILLVEIKRLKDKEMEMEMEMEMAEIHPSHVSHDADEDEYPECEKLNKINKEYSACAGFLEWLSFKNISLCVRKDEPPYYGDLTFLNSSTADLLNEYFKINAAKLEVERRLILESQRT